MILWTTGSGGEAKTLGIKGNAVAAGATIGGYELLAEVGRGAMGQVFKAKASDGNIVALKLLAPHLSDNPTLLKRFYQEGDIAMTLDHPNLVRALELGEDQGWHFFVMEFVEGDTLGARIKRLGKLPEAEALRIVVAIARALHKAHGTGLVHRDVKPDNILLTHDGSVKLADMGLAKILDADVHLTHNDKGVGTPAYMSPEQFRATNEIDGRCDIYSLAVTLYYALTGTLPFLAGSVVDTFIKKTNGDYLSPEEIIPGLSRQTVAAIRTGLKVNPEERPATARAFADILMGKSPLPDDSTEMGFPKQSNTPLGTPAAVAPPARKPGSSGSHESLKLPASAKKAEPRPSARAFDSPVAAEPKPAPRRKRAGRAREPQGPCHAVQEEFADYPWCWLDRRLAIVGGGVAVALPIVLLILWVIFF